MSNEVPELEISVRIDKIFDDVEAGSGQIMAYCTVTLGGHYSAHGIRIVAGENGPVVYMPIRRYEKDGVNKYSETFHPVTREGREALISVILSTYAAAISEREIEKAEQSAKSSEN